MIKYIGIISVITLVFSCNNDKPISEENGDRPVVLFDTIDGIATEYYPDGKNIKMQGEVDDDGNRHGKWTYYNEAGMELSFTFFKHGVKHGHSLTKYPNGAPYYYGEYLDGKMVGEWKTYDSEGKSSIKDYGYPTE